MSTISLPTTLDEIKVMKQALPLQESLILQQSLSSNNVNDLLKAHTYFNDVVVRDQKNKAKSYTFDPWEFSSSFGYKNRSNQMSYELLRRMAKTPIIGAIIGTRIEQVANFSNPAYEKDKIGFKIEKKGKYFGDKTTLSNEDKRNITYLTDFMLNCGSPENSWHGDDFDTFLRKITRDSLEMDQFTSEIIRKKKTQVATEFFATDAATFRIAETFDDDEYRQDSKLQVNGYYPSYVQIFQNQVTADFYPWELMFGVRNKYTDVRLRGYGISEIEMLTQVITWMLYADQYNGKFFSQGSAPKGILKVSGVTSDAKMEEFRQQWRAMVTGVQNAWRTPVIESEKMEWIDLHRNNTDMEFAKWQEYLIRLSCAIFKIDSSEINFSLTGGVDTKPMFESNNEAKIKYSKDKGLAPLLKKIQFHINKHIVNSFFNGQYQFVWTGLDDKDEKERIENQAKKAGSYLTINEVREEEGLDPIENGDIIANPYFMQSKQAAEQAKQQQQQGNPDSTAAVNEEEGINDDDSNSYYQDFLTQQNSQDNNPLMKSFSEWFTKERI